MFCLVQCKLHTGRSLSSSLLHSLSNLTYVQSVSKGLDFALAPFNVTALSTFHIAVIKQYQDYVEPGSSSSSRLTAPSPGDESDASVLPLGENVLINNLGIPVIVVLTKVLGLLVY